jgi:subtilase family serine protease
MSPSRRRLGLLVAPFAFAAVAAPACSSQPGDVQRSLATTPATRAVVPLVTADAVTPLPGSLHPSATPERDLGRLAAGVPLPNLALLFERSPAQKKQLARDLVAIQDPTSPSYHQWISPEEFGARYGATPLDLARATAWLKSQGFVVLGPTPSAGQLQFQGTVAQVEEAFGTEVHRYQVRGGSHFALSRAPKVPAALGGFVAGLHGTTDIKPARRHHGPAGPRPAFKMPVTGQPALAPSDYATIYDLAPLYSRSITGAGQSLAIVGEGTYNVGDVAYFRQQFDLDQGATQNLPQNTQVPNSGSAQVLGQAIMEEAELDLEWSGGIARDAQVHFVFTGDSGTTSFYDAMYYAVEQRIAPIVSASWGGCEFDMAPADVAFYGTIGDLASMAGVTVLVASGDSGAAGCDDGRSENAATLGLWVEFPASIPSVVAVGGSQFNFNSGNQSTYWTSSDAAKSYIPEAVWDMGELAGGGGGYSKVFPRPYWQAGVLPGSQWRGVPDISFSASPAIAPYIIATSWDSSDGSGYPTTQVGFTAIGGTSASTPSFAGILALLNQAVGAAVPGLGNINPQLYALYASAPAAFHDIVTGSNMVPCQTGTPDCPASGTGEIGYDATKGYDVASGLGSLDVNNLVTAWTSLTPTSTKLSVTGGSGFDGGIPEGTPLTFTATVGSSATSSAVGGTVTFYFSTTDGSGTPDLGYVLGETVVTGGMSDAGTEGATATLTIPAPVGLTGAAQVVAFYGGDARYMASYSTAASLVSQSAFTVSPTAITLNPNQQTTFTATTSAPPVTWRVLADSTCNFYTDCAGILQTSATTAGFQAGINDGTVIVEAVDSDYAEVRIVITVSGSPVDGGSLFPVDASANDASHSADAQPDSAPAPDAGPPPVGDAGADTAGQDAGDAAKEKDGSTPGHDASKPEGDSGHPGGDAAKSDASEGSGSSGGCSVAAPAGVSGGGAIGGVLLGLAAAIGRVRRKRS